MGQRERWNGKSFSKHICFQLLVKWSLPVAVGADQWLIPTWCFVFKETHEQEFQEDHDDNWGLLDLSWNTHWASSIQSEDAIAGYAELWTHIM